MSKYNCSRCAVRVNKLYVPHNITSSNANKYSLKDMVIKRIDGYCLKCADIVVNRRNKCLGGRYIIDKDIKNVIWLVENNLLEDNKERLEEVCSKLGIQLYFIDYVPFSDKVELPLFDKEVVLLCSLNMAEKLIKQGLSSNYHLFYNRENYKCSNYYPHFNEYLLNNDAKIITLGELYEDISNYKDSFFIRPDSGDKEFVGTLVKQNEMSVEYLDKLTRYSNMSMSEDIMICKPKKITHEYRLVVCDNEIIGCSRYMLHNKLNPQNKSIDKGSDIIQYARRVLKNVQYRPDEIWTLDICVNVGPFPHFKVLEIGNFSCAGLYDINLDHLIEYISAYLCK